MKVSDGVVYLLLVLPTLFALAILGQGVMQMQEGKESGKAGAGFGAFLLVLILLAYFLFIR
jgi:hypothetical protein